MIIIVGCGYLGSYLLREISEKSDEKVVATVRNTKPCGLDSAAEYVYCDVTDDASLERLAAMCKNREVTVFYLASCHNVDFVFENPEEARRINISALKSFLDTIPNIKKFFYSSTDCVYGEGETPLKKFSENDERCPINEYGIQKLEAEDIVWSYGHKAVRLPFMLGPSLNGKPHFYDNICSAASRGEAVEMIDGMYRSVLSYRQTAEIMFKLLSLPYSDIPKAVNICGDHGLSKYETGLAVAEKAGASSEYIKKISERDAEKFFKDKRASCAVMDNTLLKELLGLKEIRWEV